MNRRSTTAEVLPRYATPRFGAQYPCALVHPAPAAVVLLALDSLTFGNAYLYPIYS